MRYKHKVEFPKLDTTDPKNLETDLRDITRESDLCETIVRLSLDWNRDSVRRPEIDWLKFGQAQLCRQKESSFEGCWRLEAYLKEGVTDFEHDSAKALSLPLVGVQLAPIGIDYHRTHLIAWVDSSQDDYENFHVPRPGYNPMAHPKAYICESEHCEAPHPIVPEGFYIPPFDVELFNFVRGKKVEIIVGPVQK